MSLMYLVYYGFHYPSSPVFIQFVQDLVEILMRQERDSLSVLLMIQLILEFEYMTFDFILSEFVSRHKKYSVPLYRTEYSVIGLECTLVLAFHHLVHCHRHQCHRLRMLPRK